MLLTVYRVIFVNIKYLSTNEIPPPVGIIISEEFLLFLC